MWHVAFMSCVTMKLTAGANVNASKPHAGRAMPARMRFAFGGLALAGFFAIGAPVLANALHISTPAASFALLAGGLVGLGLRLGSQMDALERHSFEDPMTRVGNRRQWQTRLNTELDRAIESRMPLSVLMLDLDNLKSLNDAGGHGCGDRALALVGEVLLATCRSRDVPVRLGGDEFAVVLPRTRPAEAKILAERIRSEISRRRVGMESPLDRLLTVSIGIADLESISDVRADLLVESADAALYRAKSSGRDRIEVKGPANDTSGVFRFDEKRPQRRVTA
ncbi:diguanylate cyclase/phosphodiesterase (GGDEF & EAL domains) with PAS/PAC sensor(s) [Labilithrix luteola]|uniref:diguanylate cyclase n=2 Tax=Labilithrix luteola TaxID=1391654 RepID=A0A0K1PTV7_9BACT|nr:diguanylate cyclase/phosphodiesterase (GGDEF & EAL domains) with PAS/PAC sensor(s) [Labilithrix luteola]